MVAGGCPAVSVGSVRNRHVMLWLVRRQEGLIRPGLHDLLGNRFPLISEIGRFSLTIGRIPQLALMRKFLWQADSVPHSEWAEHFFVKKVE